MPRRWAAHLVLPCAALLSGCWDNSFPISDNAKLIQLHGSTWALIDQDGKMLVGPRVTGLTCEVSTAWGTKDDASYFILDLRSNEVEHGMSQQRLAARLRDTGITFAEPHEVSSIERRFSGCG